MPFPRVLPLLITCILLIACHSKKNTLSKVWFYTYNENAAADQPEGQSSDPVLTPIHFLNLQQDGQYTAYLDELEYGSWIVKDKYIVLTNAAKKERSLLLHSLSDKEMNLDINPFNQQRSVYHFEGTPNPYKKEADNPFSAANNRWRIKATKKETDQEITQRLKNHFRYWEKYFDWGIRTDKKTLDVRSLRGPLKMYGNGFELVPMEQWSDEWRSYFFDDEDRRIAYNKLLWFFTNENIAWSKTEHKFKMFVSAFQQLQQKLD